MNLSSWMLDGDHEDGEVAKRLRDDEVFDEADAVHTILTTSFMRGLALFDHAMTTGDARSASSSKRLLAITADSAQDLNAVSHWWTATLALHLIDELWSLSLHQRILVFAHHSDDYDRWSNLRQSYIQRLRAARRSAIELWPSQLKAVTRAVDPTDDLVVALPTERVKMDETRGALYYCRSS